MKLKGLENKLLLIIYIFYLCVHHEFYCQRKLKVIIIIIIPLSH
jgi:hypothetical protein